MTTELRALSFWRPWTALVMHGLKPVENRGWLPPETVFKQWLVVHAAQRWDDEALEVAGAILGFVPEVQAPTGYLGIVKVTGWCMIGMEPGAMRRCRCGPWAFEGQHHWRLARPLRFDEPIPGPGRQGLWRPPDDVVDAVNELLAREDV